MKRGDPLDDLAWGTDGLLPAVAHSESTGEVLMLAWMDREALRRTLRTGRAHYWSRSRRAIWRKGDTSGNRQRVLEVYADCDRDAILLEVEQRGAACHTGKRSCFHHPLPLRTLPKPRGPEGHPEILERVYEVIRDRKRNPREGSYVRSLFEGGRGKIARKVLEEAGELVQALDREGRRQVVHEAADLFFHALVLLAARDVEPASVWRELASRFGTSGLEEKASRKKLGLRGRAKHRAGR